MHEIMLTEEQATERFIRAVPTECFNMHKQCRGKALYVKKLKRLFANWDQKPPPSTVKVDFILEPTASLLKQGWEIGCVGVEIKSSFNILNRPGRAIAQILDYQSCEYSLPSGRTELSMLFLFPYRETGGLIASIMQQEGLGFVQYEPKYEPQFRLLHANTSHEPVFNYYSNERIEIRRPRYGKKFGHR